MQWARGSALFRVYTSVCGRTHASVHSPVCGLGHTWACKCTRAHARACVARTDTFARVNTHTPSWFNKFRLAPPGCLGSLPFYQERTESEPLQWERQQGGCSTAAQPGREKDARARGDAAWGLEPSARGGAVRRKRRHVRKDRACAGRAPQSGAPWHRQFRAWASSGSPLRGIFRHSSSDSLPVTSTSAESSVPLPALRETYPGKKCEPSLFCFRGSRLL